MAESRAGTRPHPRRHRPTARIRVRRRLVDGGPGVRDGLRPHPGPGADPRGLRAGGRTSLGRHARIQEDRLPSRRHDRANLPGRRAPPRAHGSLGRVGPGAPTNRSATSSHDADRVGSPGREGRAGDHLHRPRDAGKLQDLSAGRVEPRTTAPDQRADPAGSGRVLLGQERPSKAAGTKAPHGRHCPPTPAAWRAGRRASGHPGAKRWGV